AKQAVEKAKAFEVDKVRAALRGLVPGLAANRTSGVIDRFSSAPSFEGSGASPELPRNMLNPIHASTPPPATEKASSETPKTCSTRAPTKAATTRMTSTASAALVASATFIILSTSGPHSAAEAASLVSDGHYASCMMEEPMPWRPRPHLW